MLSLLSQSQLMPPPVLSIFDEDIRINCGGDDYIDSQGRLWLADFGYSGGKVFSKTADAILYTTDDTLYHSQRHTGPANSFSYEIPLPGAPSNYEVILHWAELYWNTEGENVFDVVVEGTVLTNIDIIKLGGGVGRRALTQEVAVAVSDGSLSLTFQRNGVPSLGNPLVCNFEMSACLAKRAMLTSSLFRSQPLRSSSFHLILPMLFLVDLTRQWTQTTMALQLCLSMPADHIHTIPAILLIAGLGWKMHRCWQKVKWLVLILLLGSMTFGSPSLTVMAMSRLTRRQLSFFLLGIR